MSMNNLKRYIIEPLVGIGPIKLGMHRDEVQDLMPEVSEPFLKSRRSKIETDSYHKAGFQVFYDYQTACVEYIELSRGCPFMAEIFGVDPFSICAEELIKYLSEKAKFDQADPGLGSSYILPEFELSVWRPGIDDEFFSTIGIGQKGYYSENYS